MLRSEREPSPRLNDFCAIGRVVAPNFLSASILGAGVGNYDWTKGFPRKKMRMLRNMKTRRRYVARYGIAFGATIAIQALIVFKAVKENVLFSPGSLVIVFGLLVCNAAMLWKAISGYPKLHYK